MPFVCANDKKFEVDSLGFLVDFLNWDEDFARVLAPSHGITDGLSEQHWRVIRFIHCIYHEEGRCPRVAQTCRVNGLRWRDLESLFPTGYLRGACKLAGITYRDGYHGHGAVPAFAFRPETCAGPMGDLRELKTRTYTIDVWGFLVDASQWDEHYASMRAGDLKMPNLTSKHWDILQSMRRRYERSGKVPTVYDTCKENNLEIDEFAALFPDGYHRGAVKIAGLRATD